MGQGIRATVLTILAVFVLSSIAAQRVRAHAQSLMASGLAADTLAYLRRWYVRMLLPRYNYQYLRLNAAIAAADDEQAESALKVLLATKSKGQTRLDILLRAAHYYLGKGRYPEARTAIDEIEGMSEGKPMAESLETTYAILADGDWSHIAEMESRLRDTTDAERPSLLMLLAQQYDNKGDHKQAEHYRHLMREGLDWSPKRP